MNKKFNELQDFYVRCPDLFLEQFIGIKLRWYQKIILRVWNSVMKD